MILYRTAVYSCSVWMWPGKQTLLWKNSMMKRRPALGNPNNKWALTENGTIEFIWDGTDLCSDQRVLQHPEEVQLYTIWLYKVFFNAYFRLYCREQQTDEEDNSVFQSCAILSLTAPQYNTSKNACAVSDENTSLLMLAFFTVITVKCSVVPATRCRSICHTSAQ